MISIFNTISFFSLSELSPCLSSKTQLTKKYQQNYQILPAFIKVAFENNFLCNSWFLHYHKWLKLWAHCIRFRYQVIIQDCFCSWFHQYTFFNIRSHVWTDSTQFWYKIIWLFYFDPFYLNTPHLDRYVWYMGAKARCDWLNPLLSPVVLGFIFIPSIMRE